MRLPSDQVDRATRHRQERYAAWLDRHADDERFSAEGSIHVAIELEADPGAEHARDLSRQRSRLQSRLQDLELAAGAGRDTILARPIASSWHSPTDRIQWYLCGSQVWSAVIDNATLMTLGQAEGLINDFPELLADVKVHTLLGEHIPW
jgi:hypothetical protein